MPRFTPTSPLPITLPSSGAGAGWVSTGAGAQVPAGLFPTTGTLVDYYNEEQYFTITYSRVPRYGNVGVFGGPSGDQPIQLSGVANTEHYVSYTLLNYEIDATFRRFKTTHPAGTSGYYQYQTLSFNPLSTDSNGFSYGQLTGAGISSLLMGPAGTITTDQKYMFRRPWVSGQDWESFDSAKGYNVAFQRDRIIQNSSGRCDDNLTHMANFESQDNPLDKGSFNGGYDVTPMRNTSAPIYYIPGGYNTAQETYQNSQNFVVSAIDTLGTPTTGGHNYYSNQPVVSPDTSVGYPVPTIVLSGVNSSRISWI